MEEEARTQAANDVFRQLSSRAQSLTVQLSSSGGDFLDLLRAGFPESRETSLAIAKVEEAMFWAAQSILKNME
jgi:hypothetical protein